MNCTLFIVIACAMLMCVAVTSSFAQSTTNTISNNPSTQYTTQDVQTLLNGKKQHLQQVQLALMETNILSDACELYGKSSALYATYSSGKSSTRSELLEVKKSLEYEIENIQKMVQDTKNKDESSAKSIADKLAENQAAEKTAKEAEAKDLAEKQAAEKKVKEEEEKKLKELSGELASSTILTPAQSTRFYNEILKAVKKNPMKLLYKATRDGFDSKSFHSKCDEKGSSVTIIKTKEGAVFGGYTSIGWKSGTRSHSDPSAFLFSLISATKEERFKKIAQDGKYSSSKQSILSGITYGPTFGGGHDIHICTNANTKTGSTTSLGHTYNSPGGYGGTYGGNTYLAGSHNQFLVSEIEVYSL